jgi:hypothetical protein
MDARDLLRQETAPQAPHPTPGADPTMDSDPKDAENHAPFFFSELSDSEVEAKLLDHPLLTEIDFDEHFPLKSKLQRVVLEYQDVFDVKVRPQAITGVAKHFAEAKPGAAGQGALYSKRKYTPAKQAFINKKV